MLFSVEQALVGRDERRAPLKTLCGRLLARLQIRYQEMVFKSSLIFRSASILCT